MALAKDPFRATLRRKAETIVANAGWECSTISTGWECRPLANNATADVPLPTGPTDDDCCTGDSGSPVAAPTVTAGTEGSTDQWKSLRVVLISGSH